MVASAKGSKPVVSTSTSDSSSSTSLDSSESSTCTTSSSESSSPERGNGRKQNAGQTENRNKPNRQPLTGKNGGKSGVIRKRRRRRQRRVTICLSNCRYEIVRSIGRRNKLHEVNEDEGWNIYWTDYSVSLERAMDMRRFQIVNHFPGMNEICRKDLLCRNLNRMRKLFPADYEIYPKTWSLPSDLGDLQTYAHTRKNKTYICKPEMGCQGRGIFLIRNIKDLNPFGKIVVQQYLGKPFLIDSFKFDLRIYVLITSVDPLRVYIYKEGLARFATAKYKPPTNSNTENSYMHLTNYAVNKYSRDYVVDEEGGSKRKLTSVYKWLEERHHDVVAIIESIDEVILKTIIAAYPVLKHNYRTCFPSHDICSACFEILGFDILLDHRLKPFVLEVNHSPSFHTDTKLDLEIKEGLLQDTFGMLDTKKLDRHKVENADRKRIQDRLLQKNGNSKKDAGADSVSEAQFKHEMENCGGYRLVYPKPGTEKYDIFMEQNYCTLYQETAASQARANCTRNQLEEYNQKKLEDERKRAGIREPIILAQSKESKIVRPESPVEKESKLAVYDHGPFAPVDIINDEEVERSRALMHRGMLIRSLGIELQAFKLLCQLGTLKTEEEKVFRRMHGMTYLQWQKYKESIADSFNDNTFGINLGFNERQDDNCSNSNPKSDSEDEPDPVPWRQKLADTYRGDSTPEYINFSRKHLYPDLGMPSVPSRSNFVSTAINPAGQSFMNSQRKSDSTIIGESGPSSFRATTSNVFQIQPSVAQRRYDHVVEKRRGINVPTGIPGFSSAIGVSGIHPHIGFSQINRGRARPHPHSLPSFPTVNTSPKWSIGQQNNPHSHIRPMLVGIQPVHQQRLIQVDNLSTQGVGIQGQGLKGFLAGRLGLDKLNKETSLYHLGGQVGRRNFGYGPGQSVHVQPISRPQPPRDNPLMLTGIRIGSRLNI